MDGLLTAQQVAALLKVELTTVYKWTSRGRIPHVKLSARAIRFSEAAIAQWLQSKTFDENGERPGERCSRKKRKFTGTLERREDIERIIRSAKEEVLSNNRSGQRRADLL
jgi:excisionase family DNA binding protein